MARKDKINSQLRKDRILILRALMTFTLVLVAVAFGIGSHTVIANSEYKFALQQFDSVAEEAMVGFRDNVDKKAASLITFSNLYSSQHPDESEWPNVILEGFYETVPFLAESTGFDSLIYEPRVTPEPNADASLQSDFEKFLFDYYDSEPAIRSTPPPGLPTPELGFGGIWAADSFDFSTATFYHDVTGVVPWDPTGLATTDMFPIAQALFTPLIVQEFLGWNVHADISLGQLIEAVLQCVPLQTDATVARSACTVLEPWVHDVNTDTINANVAAPILLQQNTSKMAGMVGGHFQITPMLQKLVSAHEGDIDVVFSGLGLDLTTGALDPDFTFTFTISDGVPSFVGTGDHHDTKFTKDGHTNKNVPILNSVVDISFYPRQSFIEEYQTDTPMNVSIGSVLLICLCLIVFFMYDYAVSRQSIHQQIVLDTKRRFVRFISHEVRTPLNTVRLGLKLFELELQKMKDNFSGMSIAALRDELKSSLDNWIELTNDVLGNSEAAVDVLSDLLNYDKIESGTLRLEFSVVAIWNVVGNVFKAFGMQAAQKSINMKLLGTVWDEAATADGADGAGGAGGKSEKHDARRLGVIGDATRIAQVLRNLLSNALKFTPENGDVVMRADWIPAGLPGDAAIDLPADQSHLLNEPRAGAIRIAVTDSGAGLSEEQLAQICTEGVQFNVNQLQAGGGSGLGLFIAKGIIEQHGGTMVVTSEGLGKGATFTIEMPLYSLGDQLNLFSNTERASTSTVDEKGNKVEARKHNFLVVDDAISNRKLLMRILKARGYLCEGAEDGAKGIEMYRAMCDRGEPPDAVLSDYEMPVMNGPDMVENLRELGCQCFILGITGNIMQQDIDYFKDHGADQVLAKPLNTDTFESLYKQHLANPPPAHHSNRQERRTHVRGVSMEAVGGVAIDAHQVVPISAEEEANEAGAK